MRSSPERQTGSTANISLTFFEIIYFAQWGKSLVDDFLHRHDARAGEFKARKKEQWLLPYI